MRKKAKQKNRPTRDGGPGRNTQRSAPVARRDVNPHPKKDPKADANKAKDSSNKNSSGAQKAKQKNRATLEKTSLVETRKDQLQLLRKMFNPHPKMDNKANSETKDSSNKNSSRAQKAKQKNRATRDGGPGRNTQRSAPVVKKDGKPKAKKKVKKTKQKNDPAYHYANTPASNKMIIPFINFELIFSICASGREGKTSRKNKSQSTRSCAFSRGSGNIISRTGYLAKKCKNAGPRKADRKERNLSALSNPPIILSKHAILRYRERGLNTFPIIKRCDSHSLAIIVNLLPREGRSLKTTKEALLPFMQKFKAKVPKEIESIYVNSKNTIKKIEYHERSRRREIAYEKAGGFHGVCLGKKSYQNRQHENAYKEEGYLCNTGVSLSNTAKRNEDHFSKGNVETRNRCKATKSLSKAIQQARMAKKMTQKELATAINEKPQVIGEYESGKAIPNGQIISKIERKLGCKLPRPGKKSGGAKKAAGTTEGASRTGPTRGGPVKRRGKKSGGAKKASGATKGASRTGAT